MESGAGFPLGLLGQSYTMDARRPRLKPGPGCTRPSFRATPLDMKAEADIHFLQGINQLIGHGWPYTSEGVEYPGWRFYAAGVFNEKNPWYIAMPDLSQVPATRKLSPPPGTARQRRRPLPAQRRRVVALLRPGHGSI